MGGLSAFSQLMAPASATGPGFLTATGGQVLGGTYKDVAGNLGLGMTTTPNTRLELTGDSGTLAAGLAVRWTDTGSNAACRNWAVGPSIGVNYGELAFLVSTAKGGNPLSAGSQIITFAPTGLQIGGTTGTIITKIKTYSQTITPASVAANTTTEQTFTVTGLTTADKVTINPGAAPTAGTGIVGVRVSAADTLAVTYSNNTAGALTPVSSTCLILATRS